MNVSKFQQFIFDNQIIENTALFLSIIFLGFISYLLVKVYLYKWITNIVRRSQNNYDDTLLDKGVFKALVYFIPVLITYYGLRLFPTISVASGRFIRAYIVFHIAYLFVKIGDAGLAIYETSPISKKRPLRGYIQFLNMTLYLIAGVSSFSILFGISPIALLSGLGALTAVILLIFKDTILSFLAGIQIASNDLVRLGDWIEIPAYGADGDVIEIALHSIKVQNFDKTISIIPTYKILDTQFKNWRGIAKIGGRRIKRAFNIDHTSIKFCDHSLLNRLKKIHIFKDWVERRIRDNEQYNLDHAIDSEQMLNGKRITNIGLFRSYLESFLKRNPNIRQDLTFLVRQLAPTSEGLPIEVYVFSNDIVWANYEAIQSDIFEHIISAIPEFDLRLFQKPTGYDMIKKATQEAQPNKPAQTDQETTKSTLITNSSEDRPIQVTINQKS
ncbi:MAG: miniconductance mechanosensitive channel [bacterium]